MDVLLLRFEAPLMSFGAVVVDQYNRTDEYPYRAMLAGLLANALGYTRRDEGAFGELQGRLRYAARRDRRGSLLVDYQTVDFSDRGSLGKDLGWTTRGALEVRKGGVDASEGTHIRYRHYLADAIVTVALTLHPADREPSLRAVGDALRAPARPLFLGRKCCVPSVPVWLGEATASSLREAIEAAPLADRSDPGPFPAIWPDQEQEPRGDDPATRTLVRVEDRDPVNAIHVGRRAYVEGVVRRAEPRP